MADRANTATVEAHPGAGVSMRASVLLAAALLAVVPELVFAVCIVASVIYLMRATRGWRGAA